MASNKVALATAETLICSYRIQTHNVCHVLIREEDKPLVDGTWRGTCHMYPLVLSRTPQGLAGANKFPPLLSGYAPDPAPSFSRDAGHLAGTRRPRAPPLGSVVSRADSAGSGAAPGGCRRPDKSGGVSDASAESYSPKKPDGRVVEARPSFSGARACRVKRCSRLSTWARCERERVIRRAV